MTIIDEAIQKNICGAIIYNRYTELHIVSFKDFCKWFKLKIQKVKEELAGEFTPALAARGYIKNMNYSFPDIYPKKRFEAPDVGPAFCDVAAENCLIAIQYGLLGEKHED